MIRRITSNIFKAALGSALAVLCFEGFLALFWPQERQTPLYESTATFPLALRANVDGIHASNEFSVRYRTNAWRMRDPERPLEKPAGTFRIVLLGDSLTFGSGVNDEDTFGRQLERILNARAGGRRYQVINAACASWGTAHHLVFLEETGFKFRPDLVLMAFHDDDPKDNRVSGFFALDADGRPERKPARRQTVSVVKRVTAMIPGYAWLAQHSHLFSALRLRLASWVKQFRAGDRTNTDFLDAGRKRPAAVWPEADWKLTAALLERVRDRAREEGAAFALLHAPFPRYNRAVEARYAAMAEALKVPHLELIDLLAAATPDGPNYFPANRHFTPRGNRLIAEALARFLDRAGMLPRN